MMKNIFKTRYSSSIICLILCISTCYGQAAVNNKIWSAGNAYTLPRQRIETGLFQPLRYGLSNSVELSAHPIFFFIIPNFTIKWSHGFYKGFALATRHGFDYPTLLLRTIARKGTGGIISPEFDVPHMVALNNELLMSRQFGGNYLLTGKAGIVLATRFGGLDTRTTIDLPLVFNRLLVFYHGYQLRTGMEFEGKIYNKWNFSLDGDYYWIPGEKFNHAFEHKGFIHWRLSERTKICLGYILCYGQYPYGSQWHLLLPLIDIQKAWN